MSESDFSRRKFLTSVATVGAIGTVGINLMPSCTVGKGKKVVKTPEELKLPPMVDTAPDGVVLKAGLIGCGGRGKGAMLNFLNAGPNLVIHSLGDVLEDRVRDCRNTLKKEKNMEVADENVFVGFDAYQKVIDSGVDVVLLAAPPYFRPLHVEAAVQARKHIFMEKPVAVDADGVRSLLASAKKADALGLKTVAGTQRRHQFNYVDIFTQVANGAIGDIVAANCYWNQNQLWYREPNKSWSEMEYMIRDWVNWTWLSGDHIVEQHVHNLDVIHWFTGKCPVKATGFGSRQRRVTGDQYDNFSVDYTYDNGMHLHSMCRQISGCVDNISEFIMGSEGYTDCCNYIKDRNGTEIYRHALRKNEKGEDIKDRDPYDQEHVNLVTCIRQNIPFNEIENVAKSTLVAIMGRVSAYTGKETTYDEILNSDLKLGPKIFVMGPVDISNKGIIPVPGRQ